MTDTVLLRKKVKQMNALLEQAVPGTSWKLMCTFAAAPGAPTL